MGPRSTSVFNKRGRKFAFGRKQAYWWVAPSARLRRSRHVWQGAGDGQVPGAKRKKKKKKGMILFFSESKNAG